MTEPLSEDSADLHTGRKTSISRDDLLAAALRYVDPCRNHLARMLALALGVADVCAELTAAGEEIEVSVPLCIGAIKRLQACVNQLPLALLSCDVGVRSCFLHDDCGVVDAIAMLLSTSETHDSRKRCTACRGAGEVFFTQGFFRVTRACTACNSTGVAKEPSDGQASDS